MGCHSSVPETIRWQVILSGSVHLWCGLSSRENLSLWNEGCHLQWPYCLLLSGKSATPVKIQAEEVDMVQFYKYLGVHINRLDRTNKPRGGRILFLKTIPSISGGQQIVQLCWIPISCYSLVLKLTLDATCAYQRYWKNWHMRVCELKAKAGEADSVFH